MQTSLRESSEVFFISSQRDAEALNLAIERGYLHTKKLCRATLIASSPLQSLTDQLSLVALNLLVKTEWFIGLRLGSAQ
jgi:Tfp pilus assembly ATPase PilU